MTRLFYTVAMQKTFASIGVLGGLVWIGLALFSFRWDVPGIVIYQSDDWAGRLGTLALAGITLGFFSFFRSVGPQGTGRARNANFIFLIGLSLMILSSIVYFWLSPKFGGVENKQFSSFLSDTFLVGALRLPGFGDLWLEFLP